MPKMVVLRGLLFLLLVSCTCGYNADLSELIQTVYGESDDATVFFIQMDDEFVSDFMKNNSNISFSVFNSLPIVFIKRFNFNAVLIVQNLGKDHFKEQILDKLIPQLRLRRYVIIAASGRETFQEACLYFAKFKFTRIYGLIGNRTYAYLPFADNRIQEIPNKSPLIDAYQDLNGFSFRTTVQRDIPRTFWYPSAEGPPKIGGCFGKAFIHFLKIHNATFNEIFLKNCSRLCIPGVVNATRNNDIDISMNSFSQASGLDFSYPVRSEPLTLLVPYNGYLDPNQYFLRPFSHTIWVCIGLTLVYVIIMDIVKNHYLELDTDVWNSFRQMFMVMISLPSGNTITRNYRFHTQVILIAFILNNIYINYFTSFLTVFITVKQYETFQDLIDNNVRIMFPDYEWEIIRKLNLYPKGFENIVESVTYLTYSSNMNSMNNTDFGYLIGLDRAGFLIRLQSFFNKPMFHPSKDSFGPSHLGFMLAAHSPFKRGLNKYIIELRETGLLEKWDRDTVYHSLMAKFDGVYLREPVVEPLHTPLSVHHLSFAWNILGAGLTSAVVAFIGEKWGIDLWKKFKHRNDKRLVNKIK